ncbi:MAG: hypothetical protein ACOYMG_30140 [Candidatus Methylumidiphilus sp.]
MANRQREVGVRTIKLANQIHRKMTAPTSLLFAGGIGFVMGEFTKRTSAKAQGTTDSPHAAEMTPLRTALNLITLTRTLYTAVLPLAWMVKSFQQPDTPNPPQEQPFQPTSMNPGSTTEAQSDG